MALDRYFANIQNQGNQTTNTSSRPLGRYFDSIQKQNQGIAVPENTNESYNALASTVAKDYDSIMNRVGNALNGWQDRQDMMDTITAWESFVKNVEELGKSNENISANLGVYSEITNTLRSLKNAYGKYDNKAAYNRGSAADEKAKLQKELRELEEVREDSKQYTAIADPDLPQPRNYRIREKTNNSVENWAILDEKINSLKSQISTFDIINDAKNAVKTAAGLELPTQDYTDGLPNGKYLSTDERMVYNKLAHEYGKDSSIVKSYWNAIEEAVNTRKGVETYNKLKDTAILKYLYGAGAGAASWWEGTKNALFNKDDTYYAATSTDVANSLLRKDLQGTVGGVAYDLLNSAGRMAPSLLLGKALALTGMGTLASLGGATAMGVSVRGEAYADMINAGFDEGKASLYADLSALSETTLTYLLSGIEGVGNKLTTNKLQNIIGGVDNALSAFAIKHVGEAVEEGLQPIIEMVMKKAITGEIPDLQVGDVLYSALLGYMTSAVLSGGDLKPLNLSNISTITPTLNGIALDNATQNVLKLGLTAPENTTMRVIAERVTNGEYGAYDIAHYLSLRGEPLTDSATNRINGMLTQMGVAARSADVIADTIKDISNGKKLSNKQIEALNNNPQAMSALVHEIADAEGTVNSNFDKKLTATIETSRTTLAEATAQAFADDVKTPADSTETAQTGVEGIETVETSNVSPTETKAVKTPPIASWSVEESNLPAETKSNVLKIAKLLGKQVRIYSKGAVGRYIENGSISGDTIYINDQSKNPVGVIIKHELTHTLEKAENYALFSEAVFTSKAFKKWIPADIKSLRQDVIAQRIKAGDKNFTRAGITPDELNTLADQEIIADFVGEMLFTDRDGLNSVIESLEGEERFNFIKWLVDGIKALIDKIKGKDTTLEKELRKLEKEYSALLKENAKNEKSTEEGVKNSLNKVFTKNELQKNIEKVAKLNTVSTLTGDEFKKSDIDLITQVENFFNSHNNIVSTKYGDVILDRDGAKSSLGHGMGRKKAAAFQAIPDVLKKGLVIDYQYNWKERGHDTAVFAAPIKIDTTEYYMAVVVEVHPHKNDYYLHEVALQKKEPSVPFKTGTVKNGTPSGKLNSIFILLQKLQDVKENIEKNNKTDKKSISKVTDSEGNTLTEAQQEFFKDSKVRDAEGSLLVTHRGSPEDFGTVFKFLEENLNSKDQPNTFGFFFTDNYDTAEYYSKARGNEGDIKSVYLNIKNPIDLTSLGISSSEKEFYHLLEENGVITNRSRYKQDYKPVWTRFDKNGEALRRSIESAGFDGVVYHDWGENKATYVAFSPDQAKLTTNTNPTADPDIRYSVSREDRTQILKDLQDGKITADEANDLLWGKEPLDEIADITRLTEEDAETKLDNASDMVLRVLKKFQNTTTKETNIKQSKFAESVQNAEWLGDDFKEAANNDEFINNYVGITNKATLKDAAETLAEGGKEAAIKWYNKPAARATYEDVAIGFILLERAKMRGDLYEQLAITQKLREIGTISGQTVQAFSILGRMTPEGMLAYAQTELGQALDVMRKIKTQRWLEKYSDRFNLTEAEAEEITRKTRAAASLPEGSRAKRILLAEIAAIIQEKIPPKSGDGLRALQRTAMLLNPKTHVRNIMGNVGATPLFLMSDVFGGVTDIFVTKALQNRGIGATRTTPISTAFAKNDDGSKAITASINAFKQGFEYAYDDWRRGISTRDIEQDRYGVTGAKSLDEHTKNPVYNALAKALNKVDRFNSFLLEAGDRPFYGTWFIRSLQAQMRLNHVTEPTQEMVDIATQEALSRTWQDDNVWTNTAAGLKRALNKFPLANLSTIHSSLPDYGLGDMLIKFTKTPANLAKAIVDFSPLGAIYVGKYGAELKREIQKGAYDPKIQKQLVDAVGKAISGTLLYAFLASALKAGIIAMKGKNDDDDDVRAFENYILGIPEYSIKIGNTWITYDWAQPLGSIMAAVSDYMYASENTENDKFYAPLVEALKSGGDVLLRQSFLKSLQEFFSTDGDIFTKVFTTALGEPSVYVPQIFSQFAELFDENRRETYSNDDFETALNKVKVKIPFLRNTLEESVNVMGETAKNPRNDVVNAFFAPGNVYSKSEGEAINEIYRVYQATGEKTAIPPKADYTITANGVKYQLSVQERTQMQRTMGSTAAEIIDEAMDDKRYSKLTDAEKLKLITNIYSYSKALAKSEIVYSYEFLHAIYGDALTEAQYNKLTDKQKKMLAKEHFLSSYDDVKSGNEADYFLDKLGKKSPSSSSTDKKKAVNKVINTK